MKNIQVIDGAINCAYSIFSASDKTFKVIFPGNGQNIEFVNDLVRRVGKKRAGELLSPIWQKRVEKNSVKGIHGTLFYELETKKPFYPTKRETDLDANRSR